jgi:hypothetical protein
MAKKTYKELIDERINKRLMKIEDQQSIDVRNLDLLLKLFELKGKVNNRVVKSKPSKEDAK